MAKIFKEDEIKIGLCFKQSGYTYKIINILKNNNTDLYCFENKTSYKNSVSKYDILVCLNNKAYTTIYYSSNEKNI